MSAGGAWSLWSNPALLSDSYKFSHYKQYPPGTRLVSSYWESRGGVWPEIVFAGLQPILINLEQAITMEDVDVAEMIISSHMGPGLFNREGFEHIVKEHGGHWPVVIRSVPEGFLLPVRNVAMTIENTCEKCFWVTNFLETILSQVWYPVTVATVSRNFKNLIGSYLEETGDPAGLPYKLHDFGFRGVSSLESSGIGGCAHLFNFHGSDTVSAILYAMKYYRAAANVAVSIAAAEHSTITSWGKDREIDAYRNMIQKFGNAPLYAVVSDSYDIFAACRMWSGQLKEEVQAAKGTLVVRPDSGTPHVVVVQVIETLDQWEFEGKTGGFGHTVNSKGYKVLNGKVRVIQGDGVDYDEARRILEALKARHWSADNIAFGMGGALLQKMDRDTQKCAVKCSFAITDRGAVDVFKSPVTDHAKRSKKGRLALVIQDGIPTTVPLITASHDLLVERYRDGRVTRRWSMDEVRTNADLGRELWKKAA